MPPSAKTMMAATALHRAAAVPATYHGFTVLAFSHQDSSSHVGSTLPPRTVCRTTASAAPRTLLLRVSGEGEAGGEAGGGEGDGEGWAPGGMVGARLTTGPEEPWREPAPEEWDECDDAWDEERPRRK